MNKQKTTSIKIIKKLFLVAIIILGFSSCISQKKIVKNRSISFKQEQVIQYSTQFLGTPYRYGGANPKGFDCSGFTKYIYSYFGYSLPRTSKEQARTYTPINRNNLEKGDLVFFSGRKLNHRVGHVGIVTEILPNHQFNFIHASTSKGVIISKSTNRYFSKRYLKARRILSTQINQTTHIKKQSETIYIVEKGNTLYSISQLYNCSVGQIMKWNNLKSTALKVGQRLIIKSK